MPELLTATAYLAGPEDQQRTELVEGVVIVHERLRLHQFLLLELAVALRGWTTAASSRGELRRGDTLGSPQLPGFALALDELFGSDEI